MVIERGTGFHTVTEGLKLTEVLPCSKYGFKDFPRIQLPNGRWGKSMENFMLKDYKWYVCFLDTASSFHSWRTRFCYDLNKLEIETKIGNSGGTPKPCLRGSYYLNMW